MKNSEDFYIQQAMKNWAATQSVPAGGRESLLRLAAHVVQIEKPFHVIHGRTDFVPREFYLADFFEVLGPSMLSRLWLAHVAVPALHMI